MHAKIFASKVWMVGGFFWGLGLMWERFRMPIEVAGGGAESCASTGELEKFFCLSLMNSGEQFV
jgi:hypothetical protein